MKKVMMLFLSLFVIVLVTGCGQTEEKEQMLVCTSTDTDDDMNIEQVISMTYKNDKLNHMKVEVNTTIIDSTVKENWEKFKENMDQDNQEFTKEGLSLKVVVDDQNYKYNTILDIDVLKANADDLKEQGFEGLKDDTSTIEDSKKDAEEDGAICEIK